VISDSAEVREICCSYLAHWKAQVETAAKLRDCMEHFQRARAEARPIDIIVITHIDDLRQVTALRQGFIDAGLMPYPRFVVGRDVRIDVSALMALKEVTLLDINPIRRAALLSAVAVAAGRASPEAPSFDLPEPATALKAPTVEEAL